MFRLLACLLLSLFSCAATWADEIAAQIVFATGQAQILAGTGVARPATRGGEVRAGETVDTRDGRVQLRFVDGASMSLQPATQFRVDRFRYVGRGEAANGDGVVMSLIKGGLRTVTGWLGKRDRTQYQMGTSVATIGIRGTDYGAEFDGSGLIVRTYAGLVEVCSRVGCVEVPAGKEVWVRGLDERPRLREHAQEMGRAGAPPEIPLRLENPTMDSGGLQPANPQSPPTAPPSHSPTYPSNY